MSEKQWRKLNALEQVIDGDWTMDMGAQAAGLSVRQFRRLRRSYESAEDKTGVVVHGNEGRSPKNRLSESVRSKLLSLRKEVYSGFNDTHFCEKLVEKHALQVSRSSVQRILREAGVSSPRGRKVQKRRKRRERRSKSGWMVLWDGSQHDWLEGRGPKFCLMGGIDDATGKILKGAHFVEHECSASYLRLLYEMARHHGVPLEIYADRHSCLRRNDDHWTVEEQLAGRQTPPQVQRAAESLGVDIIWATSPQAKGRIERAWGTFQDRLVSELRLKNVTTLEHANEVLEQYRKDHNKRFSRKPKDRSSAWRTPPKGKVLAEICSFHTTAVANKDSTAQYAGRVYDLKPPGDVCIAGKDLDIRHLLDGKMRIYWGEHLVCSADAGKPTKSPPRRRRKATSAAKAKKKKNLPFKKIKAKYQKAA